jgi:hypothetical protein
VASLCTAGSGRFKISFDGEGKAISVVILQSTGQRILYTNTINTLKRWRAARGIPFTILVPITYTKPLPVQQATPAECVLPEDVHLWIV